MLLTYNFHSTFYEPQKKLFNQDVQLQIQFHENKKFYSNLNSHINYENLLVNDDLNEIYKLNLIQ